MSKDGPDREWTHRAERVDFDATVRVTGPTTLSFFTTVKNVSQTGLKIRGGGDLRVGDIAFVHLPVIGETPCKVVRRSEKTYGLRFAHPIAVSRLIRGE